MPTLSLIQATIYDHTLGYDCLLDIVYCTVCCICRPVQQAMAAAGEGSLSPSSSSSASTPLLLRETAATSQAGVNTAEMKAHLMVKDEQMNLWRPERQSSLVRVTCQDDAVIARRECDDENSPVSPTSEI